MTKRPEHILQVSVDHVINLLAEYDAQRYDEVQDWIDSRSHWEQIVIGRYLGAKRNFVMRLNRKRGRNHG